MKVAAKFSTHHDIHPVDSSQAEPMGEPRHHLLHLMHQITPSTRAKSNGKILPLQTNPEAPSSGRPISCSVTPRIRLRRPSATNATEAGRPSILAGRIWWFFDGLPCCEFIRWPTPVRIGVHNQRYSGHACLYSPG